MAIHPPPDDFDRCDGIGTDIVHRVEGAALLITTVGRTRGEQITEPLQVGERARVFRLHDGLVNAGSRGRILHQQEMGLRHGRIAVNVAPAQQRIEQIGLDHLFDAIEPVFASGGEVANQHAAVGLAQHFDPIHAVGPAAIGAEMRDVVGGQRRGMRGEGRGERERHRGPLAPG